jgi:hypothetical protein
MTPIPVVVKDLKTYVVGVHASTSAQATALAQAADPSTLRFVRDEWAVSITIPAGAPKYAAWLQAWGTPVLRTDPQSQIGYLTDGTVQVLPGDTRVKVTLVYKTVETDCLVYYQATDKADALAQAKAQWLDQGRYLLGRGLTLDEWFGLTGSGTADVSDIQALLAAHPQPYDALYASALPVKVSWSATEPASVAPYDSQAQDPVPTPVPAQAKKKA